VDDPREALVAAFQNLATLGITQGTSGNISLRDGERMLISPSSVPYDAMRPEMVASMAIHSHGEDYAGPCKPSTEWRFHRDILRARPEIGAVVHGHPTYCTALAIARRAIPPVHYMIAAFGGDSVRCAPYAAFGTQALSDFAVAALEGRSACLLANHGMIALGATLTRAIWMAAELETLARQYCVSLSAGEPVCLTAVEVEDARARFAAYLGG
jgi:L-fuculose-phosphate aldolase